MRGATAGSTIHLNQSTTIHKKSATLFIAVRGVAFIAMFLVFLFLTSSSASAQILNGNFSNGLNNWNITYYGDSVSVPSTNSITLYPYFSGMGNGSKIYSLGSWWNGDESNGVLARGTILSQKTDLTGRTTLKFRGYGVGNTGGGYHQSLAQSYFSIDGVFKFYITASNQEYTVDVSSYTGVHNIQFTSYAYGNWYYAYNTPCTTYIDYVRIVDEPATIPTLPSSSGVISFKNDPYTNIDAVELTLNENIIDWESYDCSGNVCSWQPAYYWSALNPLFYYQDVPIVRVWEGTYENSTWHTLDTNPFLESGVSLVENPYSHVLNHVFTDSKNITSTDAAFLRADFVIRRDWYVWVSLYPLGIKQFMGSTETLKDSDYAYHTPLSGTNVTVNNPPAVTYVPPQDDVPTPTDMIRDDESDLPDDTDIDNDDIPDNIDDDDNNDGKDDAIDTDGDTAPDVIDDDDDNDGEADYVDQDDDNDGIPDPIDGGNGNSTIPDPYKNSTYEGYLPGNNSTYTYSVLKGYYSTVDGVFAPIDSGVSGVIGYVTSPVYSLSSSVNSVNGYAVSVFSSTTIAIQPASLIMEAVFDSMPDKVKGIVSYWILLTLILIVLGRSW